MSASRRLGVSEALVAGEVVSGDVSLSGGVIEAVGLPAGSTAAGIAVPAFVDWQVNGFGGVQFIEADASAMAEASAALGRAGIAYASPALHSAPLEKYESALGELHELLGSDPRCGLLGAHLEGPFLSTAFAGAHDPAYLLDPDVATLSRLCAAGPVAMITTAPELPGAAELMAAAHLRGILVAVGHTDADAVRCRDAAEHGARVLTHCWNAHRRFTARDPGPAGWALTDTAVTVGLIADGTHVAPETLALTFAAAAGRVALTTDAVAAAGTAAPLEGGAPRLADGTLAGSVATPSHMLRVLDSAGVALAEAVAALHRPQAAAFGLGGWFVRPGDPANVVVLDDDFDVRSALRNGVSLNL
ncbi:MAG: N-acetylglucosamine-6-phosphate deacetylase [Microthrixaceae bacterium]